MRTRASQSIVALIAAYAIGLQMLLSGWIVAARVTEGAFSVICLHGGDPGGRHPLGQPDSCPCGLACTMTASVLGLDAPLHVAHPWQPTGGEVIAAGDHFSWVVLDPAPTGHRPRAPPLA